MQKLTPEYLAQCKNALNAEQEKSLSETNNFGINMQNSLRIFFF